jgi:hypothetical protein
MVLSGSRLQKLGVDCGVRTRMCSWPFKYLALIRIHADAPARRLGLGLAISDDDSLPSCGWTNAAYIRFIYVLFRKVDKL